MRRIIAGILAFVFVFAGEILVGRQTGGRGSEELKGFEQMGNLLGEAVAAAIREPLSDEDEIVTQIILSDMIQGKRNVVYGIVVGKDGTIYGHTDTTKILKKYNPGALMRLGNRDYLFQQAEGNVYDIGVPVKLGDEKIGEVHIGVKIPEEKKKGFDIKNPMNFLFPVLAFILVLVLSPRGGAVPVVEVDKREELEGELGALKESVERLKEEEREIGTRIEEMRKEAESLQEEINEKKQAVATMDEMKEELEKIKQEIEEKRKELEELQAQAPEAAPAPGAVPEELEQLKEENARLSQALQEKDREIAGLRKAMEEKDKEIEELKKKKEEAPPGAIPLSAIVGEEAGAPSADEAEIDKRIEEKKRQEIELTQRIVAKRREEMTLSAKIESKRKELMQLERKIKELKEQLGEG